MSRSKRPANCLSRDAVLYVDILGYIGWIVVIDEVAPSESQECCKRGDREKKVDDKDLLVSLHRTIGKLLNVLEVPLANRLTAGRIVQASSLPYKPPLFRPAFDKS